MKERIGSVKGDLGLCGEIFAYRLPGASVQPTTYERLPYRIKKNIGGEKDCGLALEIAFNDSSKTFVGESSSFEVVYLQDRDRKNKYLGEGQIYIENVDDELYIPVVGFTYTSKRFRRNGFGTRRLLVMDAVSRFVFDEPLHSSSAPKLSQKSIWEKLVVKELAETHEFRGVQRYKFI